MKEIKQMRNISSKENRDLLTPSEFNSMQDELENIVTSTGGTLDGASGPDDNLNMLGQATAIYGSAGEFYQDSTSYVDATALIDYLILDRESLIESPQSYIAGLKATFKSTITNIGTVIINVAGLGDTDLKHPNGDALIADDIESGIYYTVIYNNTDSRFELLP